MEEATYKVALAKIATRGVKEEDMEKLEEIAQTQSLPLYESAAENHLLFSTLFARTAGISGNYHLCMHVYTLCVMTENDIDMALEMMAIGAATAGNWKICELIKKLAPQDKEIQLYAKMFVQAIVCNQTVIMNPIRWILMGIRDDKQQKTFMLNVLDLLDTTYIPERSLRMAQLTIDAYNQKIYEMRNLGNSIIARHNELHGQKII